MIIDMHFELNELRWDMYNGTDKQYSHYRLSSTKHSSIPEKVIIKQLYLK